AGGMRSSAPFSNRTLPLSASIRIAWGAPVWNPSFDFGPETGLGAAEAAAIATAETAATPNLRNGMRNKLETTGQFMTATAIPSRRRVLASPALLNKPLGSKSMLNRARDRS